MPPADTDLEGLRERVAYWMLGHCREQRLPVVNVIIQHDDMTPWAGGNI